MKEVEEFYKSDTEDDEDETKDFVNKDLINEISGWIYFSFETALDKTENSIEIGVENELSESEPMVCKPVVEQTEESDEVLPTNDSQESEVQQNNGLNKSNITDLLEASIKNLQPKLFGNLDDVIDLDTGITRPSNAKQLAEKFFRHTAKTKLHKYKVELE